MICCNEDETSTISKIDPEEFRHKSDINLNSELSKTGNWFLSRTIQFYCENAKNFRKFSRVPKQKFNKSKFFGNFIDCRDRGI